MRKILTLFFVFCFFQLTMQCAKSAPKNEPPRNFTLVFPSKDLLCIDNNITFNWNDAVDPEQDEIEYNIIIAKDRQLTDIVENRTISNSQISIILEKNTAFYWQVTALDGVNNQGTFSDTFAFFTKGDPTVNYAPFMAELVFPAHNTSVDAGMLDLTWNASDINTTDTLTYEVFFGEGNALNLLEEASTEPNFGVTVVSGKTYSWQINVTDNFGAKAIGQVSKFTVN
ncbi:hypothetical protein [uncultured Polaribacter sp.]|uniref:hypothetical protein n=1 Tax=uncultured Polaribacter sp. TaxID=174711 RepID=UPI002613FDC1|nr:hypothetical protein [uncultured Polaribacter sp.]